VRELGSRACRKGFDAIVTTAVARDAVVSAAIATACRWTVDSGKADA